MTRREASPMSPPLTCPRCAGVMRTYLRSGVEIDQCTQCLGIYLDRGELPQLIDAEAAYFQPQAHPDPAQR
jgi:Zn-finger nucleic acid-binding protein